jgi:hypothetical protein
MPKGTMRSIQVLAFISISLFCNSTKAIELCDLDKEFDIDKALLKKSLAKAALYTEKTYGKSCLVCAEILEVSKDRIEFHITSPTNKDLILNTSATIAISLPSGKVLDNTLYHSCKLRMVESGI